MTPERVVALLVASSPFLAIIASIVIAIITRPLRANAQQKQATQPDQQPALGVTVDDDHADDAIAELRESKAEWRDRALAAESRVATANKALAANGLPTV